MKKEAIFQRKFNNNNKPLLFIHSIIVYEVIDYRSVRALLLLLFVAISVAGDATDAAVAVVVC